MGKINERLEKKSTPKLAFYYQIYRSIFMLVLYSPFSLQTSSDGRQISPEDVPGIFSPSLPSFLIAASFFKQKPRNMG